MAPRNILPGKHYASSILDAINSSKIFFLLFSPYSNISEQCLKEVDRAVHAKLPIIPFRIEDHPPTEAMEYYLCNTHWLDAFQRPTGEYFPELLSVCKKILDGATPQVVRPSRPQKKFEEISGGMQEMLKKVEEHIAKDEEERINFYKNKSSVEKTKPSMKNPLKKDLDATQENYNIDKFIQESNKTIQTDSPKKKKKKKKKVELKSKKEIDRERQKKFKWYKIPLTILVFAMVFVIAIKKMDERQNSFKNREIVKKRKTQQEEEKKLVDYSFLSSKILTDREISFITDEKIQEYRSFIETKDGKLFKKVGGSLVEVGHNRIELNNLAILDSVVHKRKYNNLKNFQASKLDLKKKYPMVYFEPTQSENLNELELGWSTHSNILKYMIRDYNIKALGTRDYPDQEIRSKVFFQGDASCLVKTNYVLKDEKKVSVSIAYSKFRKDNFKKALEELEVLLGEHEISLEILEESIEAKEFPELRFEISMGMDMSKIKEGDSLKHLSIILAKTISKISNQIASPN